MQSVGLLLLLAIPSHAEAPPTEALARLKAVGREGVGNTAAARAWKELARGGPETLPAILTAMDDADPVAANWLRTAVDAIAERSLASEKKLPSKPLEQFIRQTKHSSAARRLAYDWLVRVDAKAPDRLLPGMLQDPAASLRRDAVARILKEAQAQLDKGQREAARTTYQKALTGAADKDQVDLIVERLDKLGVKVDVAAHFGFVRQWLLVAPFDNTNEAGFNVVYPPEKGVDLKAVYKGKKGVEARWTSFATTDRYGGVNLNKALGKQQGVAAYAYAVLDTPSARPIQIRIGSPNAIKIFLNGKEVHHRNEYHHGNEMDQDIAPARLKVGRNELLLKICQNEQKEDWAQTWGFMVRLCDAAGAAVPFTVKTEPRPKESENKS